MLFRKIKLLRKCPNLQYVKNTIQMGRHTRIWFILPQQAMNAQTSLCTCTVLSGLALLAWADPEGGTGGQTPPEKSQKYRVSKQIWFGSSEKSQSYQASIQCRVIICLPGKHYLNGVSLAGRWWLAFSCIWSSVTHYLKEKCQSWTHSGKTFWILAWLVYTKNGV